MAGIEVDMFGSVVERLNTPSSTAVNSYAPAFAVSVSKSFFSVSKTSEISRAFNDCSRVSGFSCRESKLPRKKSYISCKWIVVLCSHVIKYIFSIFILYYLTRSHRHVIFQDILVVNYLQNHIANYAA